MPRTLVDCAREWDLDDAVVAMDAALLAGRTTAQELGHALIRAQGWPGIRRAVRAVSLADGRAESPLGSRGRMRLVGCGLSPTALQVEIRAGGRLVGVVGGWFDQAVVAVEFDGQVKYTDPWRNRSAGQVLGAEKRREDELRALDIRVVRVVDRDLDVPRWGVIEGRLRDLLASPGFGPSPPPPATWARGGRRADPLIHAVWTASSRCAARSATTRRDRATRGSTAERRGAWVTGE